LGLGWPNMCDLNEKEITAKFEKNVKEELEKRMNENLDRVAVIDKNLADDEKYISNELDLTNKKMKALDQ